MQMVALLTWLRKVRFIARCLCIRPWLGWLMPREIGAFAKLRSVSHGCARRLDELLRCSQRLPQPHVTVRSATHANLTARAAQIVGGASWATAVALRSEADQPPVRRAALRWLVANLAARRDPWLFGRSSGRRSCQACPSPWSRPTRSRPALVCASELLVR